MPYATIEKKNEYMRKYYAANKETVWKGSTERAAKWYQDNKEHRSLYSHNKHYQIQTYDQISAIFRKILL